MTVPTGTANERIGQQAVDLVVARRQRGKLLEALSSTIPEMLRVASVGHGVSPDEMQSLQRAVSEARAAIKRAGD